MSWNETEYQLQAYSVQNPENPVNPEGKINSVGSC